MHEVRHDGAKQLDLGLILNRQVRHMSIECKEVTDCGEEGCGECDVCTYLVFLEWCGQVAGGIPHIIDRNAAIEAHLDRAYPHWRSS